MEKYNSFFEHLKKKNPPETYLTHKIIQKEIEDGSKTTLLMSHAKMGDHEFIRYTRLDPVSYDVLLKDGSPFTLTAPIDFTDKEQGFKVLESLNGGKKRKNKSIRRKKSIRMKKSIRRKAIMH